MADQTPQSTGLFASSDYNLTSITIVTSTGDSVDIKNIMIELNLYEDIFSPVMTGSVTVGDAGDIISSYKLHGNEWIAISVDKPSLGKPIKKIFRIYKIANRSFGTTALQNYVIYFCSEELILSTQNLISKSYKGLTIDTMVKDILNNKLKVSPDKMANGIFTPSQGSFDFIIPRMQPLEAIEWLVPRAYNNNQNLFLFFENRDGFNFTSYENLLSFNPYATYTRSVKITPEPDKNLTGYTFINVVEDFDIIKAIRNGTFCSSLNVLDLVNRSYNSFIFDSTQIPSSGLLNQSIPTNALQNRLGQSLYTAKESMLKFVASSDSDPTFNPANIKNWLPQTATRLGQINAFKAVISIPGDVLIKAGSIVNLVIPKMVVQDSTTPNDPMRTGKYLVSGLHHIFAQDIYTTVLELLSDSVAATLPTAAQGSQTVSAMIKA
jgi:hypothetical protein